jgi:hypothetical protein
VTRPGAGRHGSSAKNFTGAVKLVFKAYGPNARDQNIPFLAL